MDKLLDSPHYGERWARMWLDVARYADGTGYEYDYDYADAWRYRDYVIKAFNEDKPYNQFVIEQLAGDELDHPTFDSLTATGFVRLGPRVFDRDLENPNYRFDYMDDMVRTTIPGFSGSDRQLRPLPRSQVRSRSRARITTRPWRSLTASSNTTTRWFPPTNGLNTKKPRTK